jgi:hypothetical protein
MQRTSLIVGLLVLGPTATARAEGPLVNLPSKPADHVAKINALGDDSWLHLGAPAADPKWGRARGRSWTAKMPYAPDLGVAFLYGEGVHGWWNEKTGRYMDDLWAYDLNAHRWICLYPGADVKNLDLKLDENGFEVTTDGEPIPVAQMVHGYEAVAYDSDLKKFLFMPCPGGYDSILRKRRNQWLKGLDKTSRKPASPWFYDVATGKWERRAVDGAAPRSGFGDVLVYSSSQKKAFFQHGNQEVWLYDYAANKWTKKEPKGPQPPWGIDPTACLDTKRDRVVMGGGGYPVAKGPNALWFYDLKTDTWIDPKPKGQPCRGSNSYATNIATMTYDAASDVVLLNRHGGEAKERGLYVYDPESNGWTAGLRPFPKELRWQQVNGFYSPDLNVHVFHTAGDSRDDGVVWVYRYRRRR